LEAANGLLLYDGVLRAAIGSAFLELLTSLIQPADRLAIHRAAAALFRAAAASPPGAADAWQRYLVERILRDENPFSHAAQARDLDEIPAGLQRAARRDLAALGALSALDGRELAQLVRDATGGTGWDDLEALGDAREAGGLAHRFAATPPGAWPELLPELAAHYRSHGVGRFAEQRAFRWVPRAESGPLVAVTRRDPVTFDDLIGYAEQRRVVRRNTEHFLAGRPANNLLLYGERGTGKSSTVKALLNAYADHGLRLVEVAKPTLGDFPEIVNLLADQPQRFVVFVDDLSFDENEVGYTALKAILEGGIEVRPPNVVIYATSNRRHLILERFSDRTLPSDEVRPQDTMQEKLSLADRFGVTVIFPSPDQQQYLDIVRGLARRRGLAVDPARLDRLALQWAAWNNGRSGRTARQFVDDLAAELGSGL
jgi:predicted AAA+ superfamily ATPase